MTLPTEKDINVYNSLDEIVAAEHFLNKTLDEAEGMFRDDSVYYQEDLMWMGPRAFGFYLQAMNNYLKSEYSKGDDHIIYCLYQVILFKIEGNELSFAISEVNEMIDYITRNYAKFSIDENVYGNLLEKYGEIRSEIK
jgi:hypothetical protein